MMDEAETDAVCELGPDAVGFIFWPQSKRYVESAVVADWPTPAGIARVGVFVDATPQVVAATVEQARLDVVQLHGNEDPNDYSETGARLWKAVHLDGDPARECDHSALNAFLLDSRTEAMPGGTGRVCDWTAAAAFVEQADKHVILAGGLTAANVESALRQVRPWGVDVSTGVERPAGGKNLKLVEEFIGQCRKTA